MVHATRSAGNHKARGAAVAMCDMLCALFFERERVGVSRQSMVGWRQGDLGMWDRDGQCKFWQTFGCPHIFRLLRLPR